MALDDTLVNDTLHICVIVSLFQKNKKKINDDVCEECVRQMDSRSFLYSNWNKEKKCLE